MDHQIVATINTFQSQIPVLTLKDENAILEMKLHVENSSGYTVRKIKISLNGTTDLNDIESVSLFYSGSGEIGQSTHLQFGKIRSPVLEIVFSDKFVLNNNTAVFILSVKLMDHVNLMHKIDASCEFMEVNRTPVISEIKSPNTVLRLGIAIRQHGDNSVHTYRIPGLTTSANGTLLAVYDVRRESSRDLQGDIDIGLSRSTDNGNSWELTRIVLDRGTWGNLPQKFNGISDACILVDKNMNTVFVAGLWMYGVMDKDGQWIKGLTEASNDWNHQWMEKGSQPGFDVKQTPQFLIIRSNDDGLTWSEPVNLTRMCKKEEWWLWAPAPGHGITLVDGTLVFPTQGRDENGNSFSNITWSKDNGKTWTTSHLASRGTTENMVVQLSDGSLMLNARDGKNRGNNSGTNGRVISVSPDLGDSWTEHFSSRHVLTEPSCMASLHKHEYTENGRKKSILLFSNPNSKTARDHMTIKVSFDDGATWPEKYWMLLDEEKGRGYSCLTSINEETIGILYEGSQSDLIFQKVALRELIGK